MDTPPDDDPWDLDDDADEDLLGRAARPPEEASYTCDRCGEEIVVPIDWAAGSDQEYVEDCPVCCHPNVLRLHLDPDDESGPRIESELE